ncbi:MAG: DUF4214 domain-containing protein, partial [Luminiphilus sp.]|nr:DUF4214 domain-containing protein [Luminiphilus sp.]
MRIFDELNSEVEGADMPLSLLTSQHARTTVLMCLLCVFPSVEGREYTEAQFKSYYEGPLRSKKPGRGGFEGMSVTVMRGGDRTLLVKPFKPMQDCTNDGDCFIQPPFFLYEYDADEGGFVDVSALITNSEEFLIPANFTYEAGDFNGDGRDDLVFATNGEFFAPRGEYGRGWHWENFILLSNDDGTFTWQQLHEFKGVTFHGGPSIGDIDGDGDLDLFIDDAADPDDWSNYKWPDDVGGYFLFNDGKGNFTRSERRFASPSMSELADLDGDGDLDLALKIVNRSCFPELPPSSCRIFNGIYLYENNGNGDFTEVAGDIPFTTEHSFDREDDWNIKFYGEVMENRSMRSLVALDANNDGLPDLAVSVEDNDGERVNLTSILINQGGFEFSLELDRFPHVTRHQVSNRLRAIDADQDGFTDLYFENKQASVLDIHNPLSESIYFNDGKGFFSNDNRLGLPDDDGILTVADVNSDRVYDFISSWGWQQNYESEVLVSRTTTVLFSDQISAFIERFYTNILGRPADETGLGAWRNVINTQSASAVALGFLNSAEFKNRGLDDAAFVNILYRTLFDRAGDEGGTSYWLEQLSSGQLRDMVIWGFLRAGEFKTLSDSFGVTAVSSADESSYGVRAFTERFYTVVLGRQPDQAGFDGWVSALSAKTLSGGDIAKAFFLSAEYSGQNTTDSAFVETAYRAFFGRDADAAGKQGWLDV